MTLQFTRRTLLGTAALALTLPTARATSQGTISIATSIPLLQDIVAAIAGDHADVFSVMPAASDPHTWEPNPEDMVRLSESDAFVYFGANLEPFVESGGWHQTVEESGLPEFEVTTAAIPTSGSIR